MAQNYISTTLDSGATLTTNFTTNKINVATSQSLAFELNVSTISGTNAAINVSVDYSMDNGETFTPFYQFPTLTTIGVLRSPYITTPSQYIRYRITVSGTTPSIDYKLFRTSTIFPTNNVFKQLYDRTTNVIAVNNTTIPIYLGAAIECDVVVDLNFTSITTSPTFTIELSADGVDWTSSGNTITGFSSTVRQQGTTVTRDGVYLRVRCSNAGSLVGGVWNFTCFRLTN